MNPSIRRFSVLFFGLAAFLIYTAWPSGGRAGTSWTINARMSLGTIQAVIDGASDGDVVIFEKGSYDFSGAPFYSGGQYMGALNIVDKALTLQAMRGVIIKGAPSELAPDGQGTRGVVAFMFKNANRDRDVVVRGFSFKTMLMGVSVYGCNNVLIENCILTEIDRNGIGTTGVGGNLSVLNNQISSRRCGIFIGWYYFEPWGTYDQTDGTHLQILNNTTTTIGNYKGYIGGIYLGQSKDGSIAGNSISANVGYGMLIEGTAPSEGQTTPRLFITNNKIQGSDYSILLSRGACRVQVENNAISDPNWGIALWSSSNSSISGNTITNVVRAGIQIVDESAQNQIIGNLIKVVGAPGWSPDVNSYGIITDGHDNFYSENTVSGSGSAAFFVYSEAYVGTEMTGHNETFQCNNARNFKPDLAAAHYVFFVRTYSNVFAETWAGGVTVLDLANADYRYPPPPDSPNQVLTVTCR